VLCRAAFDERYFLVIGAFCLGLISKPTIVTLPFVLLLLDRWPLQRRAWLIREKIPLSVLSVAAAVATFVIQRTSGAVRKAATFPIALRIENALVSYAIYIEQTFWPVRLAVFYPFPDRVHVCQG
jgi:protein O-mannosyl-transferase